MQSGANFCIGIATKLGCLQLGDMCDNDKSFKKMQKGSYL